MSSGPICVVGMHRSGTSLTTRMLAASGIDIGPQDSLIPADVVDNRDGYQEQESIVRLDDELLRALGGHASEPPELAPGWERGAELQSFAARARELITELYGPQPWAFKDPRASLLLPFWRIVEAEMRVVVCVRNPLEVAESMLRRQDPYELEHWLTMWRLHTMQALTDSAECPRETVLYEDLIEDPEGTAIRIGRFALGSDPPPAALALAAAMPDRAARRSTIDDQTLLADPRVPRAIALEYIELRDRVRRANAGKSAEVGSIDSRASNPITTQPSAALLGSRHGS
ncbi:MAG: sulfotransferase family protein [Solirubrobacterales bacterium]